MNIESFERSAYGKTDERLAEVNQSIEDTSEGEEKEELTAEQSSLEQRKQELFDKSHDEALKEHATREQGKEQDATTTEGDEINTRLAELAAEQESLKQRQQKIADEAMGEKSIAKEQAKETTPNEVPEKNVEQELIDKSHGEALEEDATREQLGELYSLLEDEPGSVPEKNVAQEQKQEVAPNEIPQKDVAQEQEKAKIMEAQRMETKRIAMVEAKRVQGQQQRETRDQERIQRLKQRLNIIQEINVPEGKEKKMSRVEKGIEVRKMEIQKKIEELEDKSNLSQMLNRLVDDSDEAIRQSDEELRVSEESLEIDLKELNSYAEMKKRPFWKHTFDKFFRKLDANDNPITNPIFGGGLGVGVAALATAIPVAGATVAFGPALVVGVSAFATLSAGLRAIDAIARARRERKFAKEDAGVN